MKIGLQSSRKLCPELKELISLQKNKACADCGTPDPEWVSINLGIYICQYCSGIHRSLGVHVSRVKSLYLDKWTPEQISEMQKGGNKKAKEKYEFCVPNNFLRPSPVDPIILKEQWIRAKYLQEEFIETENLRKKVLSEACADIGALVKSVIW
eukprot:TRINITY_DN8889_c0_g1_i1.p1 TRINITY_DN8889_c0_g1~~TRINITY_DN8889_c0_g1_i1.p1  ORF type:complete len:169 (-),score=29.62 TRINITY_DN8889_c0_g1_i1:141-599(-)